ncbi:hypothetical protein COV61_02845, partial [Candidatus Micrarchaeota archaeon CG11_big_fil_rev_8_21_14_0_20_47_5]
MKKVIIAVLILAFVFVLAGCLSRGCTSDKNCKEWQLCDMAKKACVLREGYCTAEADCNDTMKTCDLETHLCDYKK